jgi:hypothetical protein
VVILTGLQSSKRRIAAEGEEIRVATLYFDVLPSAAEIDSTTLEVARVLGGDNHLPFDPLIIVWTTERLTGFETAVRADLEPISIFRGVLAIRPSLETLLGDANFDSSLDTSDALAVLGHLFLGDPEPLCPNTADFDRNGALEITDPISLLGALFLGVPPLESKEVPCRE